ncbi:ABC transporter ATP-binding protein [Gracilibacillus alcaliphilus]|uniref:ABC transporter ATP-binding protein n=1 Tax=Gracilibacillus alcaliphilus TaxID=1401441 RepID=UPI00195C71CC|nr:ABC transporter ATP-binding protein [Gracilibacillus alcaliphilus]MBM7677449.1 ABC-2 type transport system ATP-binding protein [Gracilibacillus alcaliphilus]
MLSIKNISKIYKGSNKGISNLSLELHQGDICAFIGANGAGKTTTIKSIVGIHPFDKGEVTLFGTNLQANPAHFKSMIGYSPDTPALYPNMTGKAYLELIASLYEIDEGERNKNLAYLLKELTFETAVHELISSYSHGMKQRLVLISLLMHNPKLIILDEPFVGLDPNATRFLIDEMKSRASEGVIILYSTHVLEVAEKVCNKLVIFHKGEVVVNDTMEHILQKASLDEIFRDVTSDD